MRDGRVLRFCGHPALKPPRRLKPDPPQHLTAGLKACSTLTALDTRKPPIPAMPAIAAMTAILLSSAHSQIFEAQGLHTGAVEEVFGVDDQGASDDALDAVEVEGAELGPAGAENQHVGAFGDGIGRIAIADVAVELLLRVGHGDGIVSPDHGALLDESAHQA